MKKNLIGKIVSLAATTALAGSLLAGCGNTAQGEIAPTPSEEISEQTVEISDKNIEVVKTRTIPESITALMAFEEGLSAEENAVMMAEEFFKIKKPFEDEGLV